MLTHFSLFSGIGGIDLAAEWAGFKTIGQCEFADYPTRVLEKHWPDVPRWRDIRDVTLESVRNRGIRTIDIISGGFPCQPFSVAGKQRGKDDDRYLWPEMLRVISELKPTWVVGENVPGIINLALEQVCADLENEGYEVQPLIIPAAGVGAHHRRKRVFILGYSQHNGSFAAEELRSNEKTSNEWWKKKQKKAGEFTETSRSLDVSSLRGSKNGSKQDTEDVVNTTGKRREKSDDETRNVSERKSEWESWTADGFNRSIWDFEPNVGRVANGIPSRVDRLKCLGNAVVPQQVYPILKTIANIEMMLRN